MEYLNNYNQWLKSSVLDLESKEILNRMNEKEIKENFYGLMEFGTAGVRSIMGVGMTKMNLYTIRHISQALANFINEDNKEGNETLPYVVVGYDSRLLSPEFAEATASVLVANGINVYLFEGPRPTPEISFAIRQLGAVAGINITASHNPKQYNGYKVYGRDGAQIGEIQAEKIAKHMEAIDLFEGVNYVDTNESTYMEHVKLIGKDIDVLYLEQVMAQSTLVKDQTSKKNLLNLVYTPLHGTGHKLVPEVLEKLGVTNYATVEAQMEMNGHFPTLINPNPDNADSFELAINLAKEQDADLIIGTDPDADRMGAMIRDDQGEFITLSGNQIGILILNHLISEKKKQGALKKTHVVIKSFVSTDMARKICEGHDIQIIDVPTGFKNIGEKMTLFQESDENLFLFGFEESNGYLTGGYARDKDGILAAMLLVEVAYAAHLENQTLHEVLKNLYEEYGYCNEKIESITVEGVDGLIRQKNIIENLRVNPPKELGGIALTCFKNYIDAKQYWLLKDYEEPLNMVKTKALEYILEDGTKIVIRPSGTEPKIKVYLMTSGENKEACREKRDHLFNDLFKLIDEI